MYLHVSDIYSWSLRLKTFFLNATFAWSSYPCILKAKSVPLLEALSLEFIQLKLGCKHWEQFTATKLWWNLTAFCEMAVNSDCNDIVLILIWNMHVKMQWVNGKLFNQGVAIGWVLKNPFAKTWLCSRKNVLFFSLQHGNLHRSLNEVL